MTHREPRPDSFGGEAYQLDLSRDVSADTPTESPENETETIPKTTDEAWITQVVAGWRDGADNAVGIQLRTSTGRVMFPRGNDDYIALNDVTIPFDVYAPISGEDELEARFVNLDSDNNHWATCIVTIQEVN